MKTISILGCGDFLKIQAPAILSSKNLKVGLLFDPDQRRAESYAKTLGGRACATAEEIFADKETDIVGIFVPPWVRRGLFEEAVKAGKAIVTTKPFAASQADADAMVSAARSAGILCGVIYNRTENPSVEALKDIFAEGEFGKLALYRQDWMHAYPKWNKWAIDPEKNGGPFMDAMIHNLNIAGHLMGRPAAKGKWVSENLAHPEIPCADTESMTVYYEGKGMASLFISWAADLANYSVEGNDREHLDYCYMVTDQGWRVSFDQMEGRAQLRFTRHGETRYLPVPAFRHTHFELFAEALEKGEALPRRFASVEEAAGDIHLICRCTQTEPSELR